MIDGNDVWEALFSIFKGFVPEEMDEGVCEQLARDLNGRVLPAVEALRFECNRVIQKINTGAGTDTPGFTEINALLKRCDAVFQALPISTNTEKSHDR